MKTDLIYSQIRKVLSDLQSDEFKTIKNRMTREEFVDLQELIHFLAENKMKDIQPLLEDEDFMKEYMDKLFKVSQIIKKHQRQGVSQPKAIGRVNLGKTRIGRK